MKTLGLIGGMSWESTALYYRHINRTIQQRLGGLHSARLNLISLDFDDIAQRQREEDWAGMTEILVQAAQRLEATGAQAILIGTNTMHKVAHEVAACVSVPLLHIADATAQAAILRGCSTVALLGTRFTMEQRFYRDHLAQHGVRCVIPGAAERAEVHRVIFEELCRGEIRTESRHKLSDMVQDLVAQGAQAVVLGCTELPMILGAEDANVPVLDTTLLHAQMAVEFALATSAL